MADGHPFGVGLAQCTEFTANLHQLARMVASVMADWQGALLWFWLPLILVPLGIWMTLARHDERVQRFGSPLAVFGLVLVMASPWTAPDSDSSASGHLLLAVAGPVILMGLGCLMAIFGGPVPVGRLPPLARMGGFLSIALGLAWLLAMHFFQPPIWRTDVNPYWNTWWSTFLLMSVLLAAFISQLVLLMGEQRGGASLRSGVFGLMALACLAFMMTKDGVLVSAEEMRANIWLSSADLLGTLIGLSLAIIAFTVVITLYEKSLPEPAMTHPLESAEEKRVVEILGNVLGGESE